ncbi:MAG: mannose-6-phosphate isomerase, class I [Agathobacter rectalis]|nr:mannose-6-phosphate isomerase, class I [Agathobacter rectalis]
MSIHLYKHNEDAYRAVETMLEEKQMAAVIHPTGTGKSMIAFKLVEQHPHKHFLWLSPSEYIYKTQLENIDTQFSNIEYMSYSRLMKHEDSIDTLRPDYIILDEFHRCGAAEWGKSVRKLLEAYPKAKRLGLSATNIRYLDNQRNMAEELFEGNIASEMTLGEAIVREILPEPKYVIAMYSYKKELEQLKKRIEGLSNPGLISENEKLLEQLKRALEQADGLTEVFARQMTKPDGKYIVFCSGREHMDEMKAQAGDWFSKVDKKPHIYTAYYNEASTSKAFAEFKKDTGSHLKLLYCIDMLNEGIHVDDVDGVILLRPTVSPIIYLQQIGRALSAGSKNQPVIFDLVNNFDSLYCIDCLKNEMQEAFLLYPDTHSPRAHLTPLAETWECSVHPDGPSYVANGIYKGQTLAEVLNAHSEYLGTKVENGELPVLVKFIDAKKDLSVQVHPDDAYARKHEGDNGKTEMWYVVDADEGAHLIYGFQHKVTEEILRKAIETGTLDKHLQKVEVHKGDTYFVPAGTVHGIGKGILVAEIQESSNVTYRVYDYDRVDKNGKKRELHFDKAVQVMDMNVEPDVSQKPRIVKYYSGCSRELLCRCKYFETERIQVTKGFAFSVMDTSFQVLMCLNGYGEVQTMDAEQKPMRFSKGETLFLPAGMGRCLVVGDAELIKVRC